MTFSDELSSHIDVQKRPMISITPLVSIFVAERCTFFDKINFTAEEGTKVKNDLATKS